MELSKELRDKTEWVIVGTLGPKIPPGLEKLPALAVDGGANHVGNELVWIGDSDSFQNAPTASHVFRLQEKKDASDFSFALKLFQEQKKYHFHLWGFSGGRKDHELFVWGEILTFLEEHPECKFTIYDSRGRIESHFLGSGQWRHNHCGLFSLGSLRKIRVRLTGDVKYPINMESWLPPLTSWGLSNEGHGLLDLENEGPVFLYYPESP